jgi:hypothetical protein
VMDHLARCADCRDVVVMALPATEILATRFSVGASRSGWLSQLALRWGALAAGILVVASVGVVQYGHRHQEKNVASNSMQRDAARTIRSLPQSVAPAATASHNDARKESLSARNSPGPLRPRIPQSGGRASASVAHGGSGFGAGMGPGVSPHPDSTFAQAPSPMPMPAEQNSPIIAKQQVAVAASSQMVEVESAPTAVKTETAPPGQSQNQIAQNQNELPLNGRAFTNVDVVKAKDPVPARWGLTPQGALQRSYDGGKTWENVNPNASPALVGAQFTAGLKQVDGAEADVHADVQAKDKKLQKAASPANSNPVFRAVVSNGLEVWVGGSVGALYHSADGGNLWTRVTPSAAGATLTGDIIDIQFSDPQHGKIATSTSENWITLDGGQTWLEQR